MFEQLLYSDISYSLSAFLSDPIKFQASIASISVALLAFALLKSSKVGQGAKVALIYLHLATLFFPLVLFAYSTGCSTAMASCAGTGCAALVNVLCAPNLVKLLVYPIPITLVLAMFAGFVVLPAMQKASSKAVEMAPGALTNFAATWAKKLGVKAPRLYLVDSQKPFAYSFKAFNPAIFLSVGLVELLNAREKHAVVLHELYHLKEKDSRFKFSTTLMKASPFSIFKNFSQELSLEERRADEFAALVQGTWRHVDGAKRKLSDFERAAGQA